MLPQSKMRSKNDDWLSASSYLGVSDTARALDDLSSEAVRRIAIFVTQDFSPSRVHIDTTSVSLTAHDTNVRLNNLICNWVQSGQSNSLVYQIGDATIAGILATTLSRVHYSNLAFKTRMENSDFPSFLKSVTSFVSPIEHYEAPFQAMRWLEIAESTSDELTFLQMGQMVDSISEALNAGEFAQIDQNLAGANIKKMSVDAIVTVSRMTFPAKPQLNNWNLFISNAASELRGRGEDVDAIRGLI